MSEYKQPKRDGENGEDWEQDPRASMNVAPVELLTREQRDSIRESGKVEISSIAAEEDYTHGIDPEDPMFEYLVDERRKAAQRGKIKQEARDHLEAEDRTHRHHSRSTRDRGSRRSMRSRSRDRADRPDKEKRRDDHRSSRRERSRSR